MWAPADVADLFPPSGLSLPGTTVLPWASLALPLTLAWLLPPLAIEEIAAPLSTPISKMRRGTMSGADAMTAAVGPTQERLTSMTTDERRREVQRGLRSGLPARCSAVSWNTNGNIMRRSRAASAREGFVVERECGWSASPTSKR